jgi:dihydroorotate dehydrogenase
MHRLIIGCPFGNYFSFRETTSTIGTYTWKHRGGWPTRLWRLATTVRYDRRTGSWVNRMRLPCPSITSIPYDAIGNILSVHGFDAVDWLTLVNAAYRLDPVALELNASCPNVEDTSMLDVIPAAAWAVERKMCVVVKLPPYQWLKIARPFWNVGVRYFHCCNTIPVPGGGMSGKPLKPYVRWAVSDLRQEWGADVKIVAGGGVTSLEDVEEYVKAGANHVAIASMLFWPWNWPKVPRFVQWLENYFCRKE